MTDHSRAEEIFAQFLARRDAGAAPDFEAWIGEHAELSAELRGLEARWRDFQARYEQLRAAAPETAESERARELLARLAGRRSAGERFERRAEIGQGGMGLVFRAFDPDLERELALKVTREDGASAERTRRRTERFLSEARITGQLQHPGIVPIHELGLDGEGRVFYTMPLIEGEDLERVYQRIQARESGWTRTRALGSLLRVCETMAYAHARGVVHGDLKPANVRLGRFGEVYVMDWGLARVAGTSEAPVASADGEPVAAEASLFSRVFGTPAYLAPESVLAPRAAPDPRTDVYAVGAMLYRLLTGRVPHAEELRGARDLAALREVVSVPPTPVGELAEDSAPELVSICARAMASQRDERYPDMRALAEDLRAFLEGRVVSAHGTGALVELRKWIGRNRATAAALLLVVLSLAAGLLVSHGFYVRARENGKLAGEERDRVLRLADGKRLRDLVSAADALWPALPERVADYDEWLHAARELARRLELHRATLVELRRAALPDAAGRFVFADTEAQWQHDALAELVDALAAFTDPATGRLADVERRREFASTVEERTRSSGEMRARWDETRRSIADRRECPAYGGLALEAQLGLVPLGRDPDSGLWEFAHLQSGLVPGRGADGRLALEPASAIVLVLMPGGTFLMGAQSEDPELPNYDPEAFDNEGPPHEVTLAPFFLSKYELSQGQWLRTTGVNPSTVAPGAPESAQGEREAPSLLHPVETVGRGQCARLLQDLALELPTEAQWEYAARAGTSTPWWTGADPHTLQGAANLADQAVLRHGDAWPQIEPWLDDGFVRHAPVTALRANPFGLHHVHGNVWEWCRDDSAAYDVPARPGDGLRLGAGAGLPVGRGGGYVNNAAYCRVTLRDSRPDAPHLLFGVRPARRLDP